ncbi:hypothetical protein Pan241w_37500 [Gimesia alba]|uniref:Uncharacterized protein n=1 Tax=Gimesia alba TaxID=2527973 RepID=A0A517RIE4_9PLAN|nr:hypothetical protein [Gimesia alba]QDT43648.1 hypothetical protein Pan241w_37500 [Gimesia alba]
MTSNDNISNLKGALGLLNKNMKTFEFALDMPKALIKLYDAGNLNLLKQEDLFHEIELRAKDDEDSKKSLGEYLGAEIATAVKNQHTVFIESGTTFGPTSAYLSHVPDIPDKSILTNNFLTLTSLDIGKVRVTEGSLEVKYLALLDFINSRRIDPEVSPEERERDIRTFLRLDEKVSEVDTIYMTSSNFGFLIGPMVGGRANALFKYCLVNNKSKRKIRLCISFEKLLIGKDKVTECAEHVENCYTVMDVEELSDGQDATLVPDYEVLANPNMRNQARSAADELLLSQPDIWREGHGLRGLYTSWLDVIRYTPPNTLEIVVGIGREQEKERKSILKNAISQCNKVLKAAGIHRAYVKKSVNTHKGIVLYVVDRPKVD